MNADLLAMLSGGGLGVSSASTTRQADESKVLVSIKAGKMDATFQPHNGKFLIKPNDAQRRGMIQLVWQMGSGSASSTSTSTGTAAIASGVLKFEWKDRRTDAKDYESVIFPEDRCSISKVGRETDRVYLFQYHHPTATTDTMASTTTAAASSNPAAFTADQQQQRRHFFYLQDKNTEHDEDLLRKFSRLLQSRAACIIEAGGTPTPADYASSTTTSAATTAVGSSATSTGTAAAPSTTTPTAVATVDALSSILENLGVPLQPNSTATTSSATTDITGAGGRNNGVVTTNPTSTSGGMLTLSDLQGAMASLATHSPLASGNSATTAAATAPPLQEIVSADLVEASGILNDPAVRQRLIDLLPEQQRTEEDLRQNLRSPQVQQALQSLSAAISPNSNNNTAHDLTAFHNVIVNFSMNPDDGAIALANGDPIQAFLDCLLASVQREQQGDDADNNVTSKTEDEDDHKMDE